jgi:endonuclease/exonuclease/phosphatase family metal-dependent hydrolase
MRLLTYNIHKGIGGRDRRYDLDRVVAVIQAEEPDLVCLQEVDRHVPRSDHHDQPCLLAERLGMAGQLFQFNVPVRGGGYGNLLLSRWPFHRSHQFSLRHGRRKPRGGQVAVVETPEGPLCVVNTHLGLSGRERHWQMHHLLGHPLFHECCHHPTVIAGDTNDWRNRLAHGPCARHGFHQVTAPRGRFRSFPAFLPMMALDKVFVRGSVAVRHARTVRSPLARRASDHLPLVVDFHLMPETNGAAHPAG